jgi:GYD domain
MPLYLVKFSYTPEAWAKLVKEPEDRRETIAPLLEAAGGKLRGLWFAFGDHDGYVLAEGTDNTTVAHQPLGCGPGSAPCCQGARRRRDRPGRSAHQPAAGCPSRCASAAGSSSPALATAWSSSKATASRCGLWEDDIEKVPS